MHHMISTATHAIAGMAALGLAALTASAPAAAATNYLANPNFATLGPNGSPTSCGYQENCPAAAANWTQGTYYEPGVTGGESTTELVPSTLVPGTTMMHVTLQGTTGYVLQHFTSGLSPKKTVYACVWLYISSSDPSALGVYAGTYPDSVEGGAVMFEGGHWEVVTVSDTPDPKTGATDQIIIFGGNVGEQVDFYLQTASVSTSQGQCKAQ